MHTTVEDVEDRSHDDKKMVVETKLTHHIKAGGLADVETPQAVIEVTPYEGYCSIIYEYGCVCYKLYGGYSSD